MRRVESKIGVGMIGLGTVGGGVEKWFKDGNGEKHGLELKRIAVANPDNPRETKVPLTGDVKEIINDPSIQIVVELMGGVEPASDYIFDALRIGKNVVTANKAAVATNMPEFFGEARASGVDLAFEASVGGGIRAVKVINSFQAERLEAIKAILNGTSNYILSQMEKGMDFDRALSIAQEKGFAESDYPSDIGGYDTRYKLAILASLGFNTWIDPEKIDRRGIADITPIDLDFASKYKTEEGESGYSVKLLGIAKRRGKNSLELRVTPALLSNDHQLSHVRDEYNAVFIEGSSAGDQMLTGKGAGREATTSAVAMDLIKVGENLKKGITEDLPKLDETLTVIDSREVETAGYLRLGLKHVPGSGAEVFKIMSDNGLNVADSLQRKRFAREINGDIIVPDINTIETAKQESIDKTLKEFKNSDRVHGEPIFIPFEK